MSPIVPFLLAAYAAPAGPALLWAMARTYETPAWGRLLRTLGARDGDVAPAPAPAWRGRLRHARVVATLTLAVALAAALWPIAVTLAHHARGRA